jgi:hypothetical protein
VSLSTKDTNPKDSVGIRKVPRSTVPATVTMALGLAMLEGARKYGRHNYRVAGVRASVYYDACMRHMDDWWEGEDIDPDSRLNHVIKAMATLAVLYDSIATEKWVDDRPPKAPKGWMKKLNEEAARIIDSVRPDNPEEAYTCLNTLPSTLKPSVSISTPEINPSSSQPVTKMETQSIGDSESILTVGEWTFLKNPDGTWLVIYPN